MDAANVVVCGDGAIQTTLVHRKTASNAVVLDRVAVGVLGVVLSAAYRCWQVASVVGVWRARGVFIGRLVIDDKGVWC